MDPRVIGDQDEDTEHEPESESDPAQVPEPLPDRQAQPEIEDEPSLEQIVAPLPQFDEEITRRMSALARILRCGDEGRGEGPRQIW
jgi:hypothetical protein